MLGRNITFYDPGKIKIGDNVYIAYGAWVMGSGEISIGDEVMFGPYCIVVSSEHTRKDGSFRLEKPDMAPVIITHGSWLGSHVVVTAGCQIGSGTVIAAHSVVTNSIPDNVIAGGLPARIIKQL